MAINLAFNLFLGKLPVSKIEQDDKHGIVYAYYKEYFSELAEKLSLATFDTESKIWECLVEGTRIRYGLF